MATIQSIEKLNKLLLVFSSANESLEKVVACERIRSIIHEAKMVMIERTKLREERRILRLLAEEVQIKKHLINKILHQHEWHSSQCEPSIDRRRKINVNGMVFECSEDILTRDPHSRLARLVCSETQDVITSSHLPIDEIVSSNVINIDTDWWIFRYILLFLRDGSLPDATDRATLIKLYREAGRWELRELQRAVEEECLHLRSSGTNPVSLTERTSGSIQRKNGSEERWWKCLPPWWACTSQRDEVCSPVQVTQTGVNISAEHDWWTADKYQKQNISPASTNELPLLPLSGTHLNTSTYEDTRSHKETSLVMNDDKRSLQTSGTWSVPQLTSLSTSAGVSSADTIGALRSKQ